MRSCLIDPSVVQRKRGISVHAAEKGDVCVCVCCLSYNCFEGREYCLKRCLCDCYETWEGRMQMERKIEEEREQRYEEEEDQDAEESWKREREGSTKTKDLDTEYHHKDLTLLIGKRDIH